MQTKISSFTACRELLIGLDVWADFVLESMCTPSCKYECMVRIIEVSDRRRAPFRSKKPFELSLRDKLLFNWLVAFDAMTRDHISRLWGINHSAVSKRLRQLREHGYITDKALLAEFPNIISITSKGARHTRWLKETKAGNYVSVFKVPKFNTATTLMHTLMVMDMALTWAVYGRKVVSEKVMKHRDRPLRDRYGHGTIYAIDRESSGKYYPDFLAVDADSVPHKTINRDALLCDPKALKDIARGSKWRTRDKVTDKALGSMVPKINTGVWAVEIERSRKTTKRYKDVAVTYDFGFDGVTSGPFPIPEAMANKVIWYVADQGTRRRIHDIFDHRRIRAHRNTDKKFCWERELIPWLAPPSL